ncbi:MAG: PEP-CTERM sorting domain-containing protein [Planctomycetes bacterium]|nr:PEP-CTERM sorting domain-containing protein [Planctomycetota bacterium]
MVYRSTLVVALGALLFAGSAHAVVLSNGGFEAGTAINNIDNATDWDWTPDNNGERVQSLDLSTGSPDMLPYAGSWFGYVENSTGVTNANVAQYNVAIPSDTPVLQFYWRFFTNETPGDATHNDRFNVTIEGPSSTTTYLITNVVNATFVTTNGPLLTPLGSPTSNPGRGQSFANYTVGPYNNWDLQNLNVAGYAGQTVNVYFNAVDGGSHNQSSGLALDNVDFVIPEPASLSMLAGGGLLLLRRRRA